MALQVAMDLSHGAWTHLSAMLPTKICNWPVVNLSHETDPGPAELGPQVTVRTPPHYTSGNREQICTSHNKSGFENIFFPQNHSLFPLTP